MVAWTLATEIQEFGCTIPEDGCELRSDLHCHRLWVGLTASSCVLASGESRCAKLHVTILTAYGIANMPPLDLMDRLERSLKKAVSSTPFLVAGAPEPILDPTTDLPHRAIVTLHVRSQLHAKLFSARNAFLQSFQCRTDFRTSFHLSVDKAELPFLPDP